MTSHKVEVKYAAHGYNSVCLKCDDRFVSPTHSENYIAIAVCGACTKKEEPEKRVSQSSSFDLSRYLRKKMK